MAKGTSLALEVADEIRMDIMAGRVAPGERLRVTPLCQRFGVSTSVIREALTRLSTLSLVVPTPQLGFTVVRVDEERIRDLAAVRSEVEATALRWAIENGDAEWEAGIIAALAKLERVDEGGPDSTGVSEEWAEVHRQFHAALVASCGSPVLARIREQLFDESELHRRWAFWGEGEGRDSLSEHRAIAQAALERAPELATALIKRHIDLTRETVVAAWHEGKIADAENPLAQAAISR